MNVDVIKEIAKAGMGGFVCLLLGYVLYMSYEMQKDARIDKDAALLQVMREQSETMKAQRDMLKLIAETYSGKTIEE